MKEVWVIRVSGYGTFEFTGTEEEAEKMRIHKARWEGGSSLKWCKNCTRRSDKITAQIAMMFDSGKGIPASLLRERRIAIQAES